MKKEIKEEVVETEEEESRFKKILIVAVGVFLVLLMLSFVFVTFPIADIIAGFFESSPIQGNVISLGNFSISLENETYEILNDTYFKNQKNEISACLMGYKVENVYHIPSLYMPETYLQTFSEVVFQPCSNNTLIMLHTHPYKECVASETDFETLNKTKKEDPGVLMVVMCESNRFAVYS